MLNDNIRIDVFYEGFIMGVTLPDDWMDLSEDFGNVGRIKLYVLNWYDIIINKIARSEIRDIEDIMAIINTQKIDLIKLKKRYYDLAETSLIADYDIKFKHLERELENDFRKTN